MFDLERAKKEGCRTEDGREARILADDLLGQYPIAVAVKRGCYEEVGRYTVEGRLHVGDSRHTLVNHQRKFKLERFVNVYRIGNMFRVGENIYEDAEHANHCARLRSEYIGTFPVSVQGEEGGGVSLRNRSNPWQKKQHRIAKN